MQQSTPHSSITASAHFDLAEPVVLLHQLDLGQHTLFMMSDGSISLLAHDEQASSLLADNRLSLDSDETYRLFISLHEQFKPHRENEAEATGPIPVSPLELADQLDTLQARIAAETPWIVPLRRVHGSSHPLLAVKDARLGHLCTAFGSEADYEYYCSLFHHHHNEGGRHGS